MAVLIVEKGRQPGLRLEVLDDTTPTVLGRDGAADIVLDDERASRLHAKIFRRLGEWVVEDLGSRNGILVRGKQVARAEIKDGETLQIGSTVLRLREGERVDPLSGSEVLGARLVRLLSEEGGVLSYQAQQLATDRPVRVDLLHPRQRIEGGTEGQPGELARRLEEAAGEGSAIEEPNVLPLLRAEISPDGGSSSVFLRWSDAPSLASALDGFLALPLAARLQHFRKLAGAVLARGSSALSYPLGLRHILFNPQEGPLVAALELSALLAHLRGVTRDLPAFPHYLPPEAGGAGGAPSFPFLVYNLGAIGYHLLTGIPPMGEAASLAEILERHRELPPAPPSVACPELPEGVGLLLSRMLEKDPARRPQSAEEVLALLDVTLLEEEAAVPPEGGPEVPAPSPEARPRPLRPEPPRAAPRAPEARGGPVRRSPSPAASRAGGAVRPKLPAKPGAPAPPRAPPRAPAEAEGQERASLGLQLILWPAFWAALFLGGWWLMRLLLERGAR
jgi:serine/threonine-protein kinase